MLSAAGGSVEVEAFLHGGGQQTLPHDVLGGVFRKLQVVNAGVDRRVARVCGVHLRMQRTIRITRSNHQEGFGAVGRRAYLPDDGEAGVQVGQASRGQRGAAGGELQECLPLVRRHPAQNSDEALEAGTEGRRAGWVNVCCSKH